MSALKPLSSVVAPYWSFVAHEATPRRSVVWGRFLAFLPFLAFPYLPTPGYLILASSIYMTLVSGSVPAWMELLKRDVPKLRRERAFAYVQSFGYMGGGLLPFMLGSFLDDHQQAWRWLFPALALCSLSSLLLSPLPKEAVAAGSRTGGRGGIYSLLARPWRASWSLLCQNDDFRHFQVSFMALGSGLMIVQPALPIFFVDTLHLSYLEVAVALTLCKGFGFALASPFWARHLSAVSAFRYTSAIAAIALFFPLGLLATQKLGVGMLYLSYFLYGIAQAGNELMWNMSGVLFSKERESSLFTTINIAAIGLRGCTVPLLSGLLLLFTSPAVVFGAGALLCGTGALFFLSYANQAVRRPQEG